MHADPTARLILAATLQLALLGAITALAIAGVIPGSTVVALLGSHLAIRALASISPPSGPSSGASSGMTSSSSGPSSPPDANRALRVVAELGAVLAGGAAVLDLGRDRHAPRSAPTRIGFALERASVGVGLALAVALSLTSCTPGARATAAGVVSALDGPACTLVSLFVADRNAGVVCESVANLLEGALSIRAASPPDAPGFERVAGGSPASCELAPLDDAGRKVGWICADLLPAARRALGTRHAR